MVYTATITSKRQLTIPASIFKRLNLKQGEKVVVSEEKGVLKITPTLSLVHKLTGSVPIPLKFKRLTPEEMVAKAKEERFHHP